jgi:polyisoprenoid-binding protein YceI
MKKFIKASVMGIYYALFISATIPTDESEEGSGPNSGRTSYTVKNMEASIIWTGRKITGANHTGSMELKENSLEFMGKDLVGGSFVVDMNSIKVMDLSGSSAEKLTRHLKSDDFFGVSNYPESNFTISDVKAGSEKGEYKVTGDLRIKSTTLPISFPVQLTWKGNQAIATAEIKVNRADFDVRYGSGRFFAGLGDRAINDEFMLEVRIVSYVGE